MSERVDNTKTMAVWGRLFLTFIILTTWIITQLVSSIMIAGGFGFLAFPKSNLDFGMGCAGLSMSALLSCLLFGLAYDVWNGSRKETP